MTLPHETRVKTGVLVVDDSAFMRAALSRMINSDSSLFVVGTAHNGEDALRKISDLSPDVITLDVQMPGLNGLETLRRIRARFSCPVIMVSAVTEKDAEITFAALSAGAFDYVPKQLPETSLDIIHIRHDLIAKIKAAGEFKNASPAVTQRKPPQSAETIQSENFSYVPSIVAIGTSTGGPHALEQILPELPSDLPIPILIVQHMPKGLTKPFAERLNTLCPVRVKEAAHRDPLHPGVVYIAPAGMHLVIERPAAGLDLINLTPNPANSPHIPSIDVTMSSLAASFGKHAMGIILTGMGNDGAQGMKAIRTAGGFTIGQDEASCTVYGMPKVCAEIGVLQRIVPLNQIPRQILQITNYRKKGA